MSEEAQDAVAVHSKATGGALACLYVLARRCHPQYDDFVCWPSRKLLAVHLHVTEGQVKRYLSALREMGEIRSERHGNKFFYFLCLPYASEQETAALVGSEGADMPPSNMEEGADTPPPMPTGGTSAPQGGGTSAPQEGAHLHQRGGTSAHRIEKIERDRKDDRKEEWSIPLEELKSRIAEIAEAEQTPSPSPPPQGHMAAKSLWTGVLSIMRDDFGEAQQDTWLKRVVPGWSGPDMFILRCPSTSTYEMVRSRYKAGIELAARKITGKKHLIVEVARI